jgi:hypothetical protein
MVAILCNLYRFRRDTVLIAEITAATVLWISLSTGLLINHTRNKLQASGMAVDTGTRHGLAIKLGAGSGRNREGPEAGGNSMVEPQMPDFSTYCMQATSLRAFVCYKYTR